MLFVPTVLPGLVATRKQNRVSGWIKGIENAVRFALTLDAQFTQLFGSFEARMMRESKPHPEFAQQLDDNTDALLFFQPEFIPPHPELVGDHDFNVHSPFSPYRDYSLGQSMIPSRGGPVADKSMPMTKVAQPSSASKASV